MMTWLREHVARRPDSPAIERAEVLKHDLADLIERRERESRETVDRELRRRQHLATGPPTLRERLTGWEQETTP